MQLSGATSPADHALKSVALLKMESSQRAQSPLRESSIPVPSTEDPTKDELPVPAKSKRPAPAKTKKGTAATVRKERPPPAKKRKLEKLDSKRADTPSSRASKAPTVKGASTKGTPMNSSPAPSMRSNSAEPVDEQDEEDEDEDDEGRSQDGDLYCICRKPDSGTFMIGCDGKCDDWFHGKCVNIPERDKNLIDKYICASCHEAGLGPTTWKRMCRREGCRQPAKLSKSKSGGHTSKYCSEDCGVLYFQDLAAHARGQVDSAGRRAARSQDSLEPSDKQNKDVEARGGALAAGEVKALLNASQTAEEFRRLGDGVLSPPATPDDLDEKIEAAFTESEIRELQRIDEEKEGARQRHTLLKDRMKFITLAKQAASRVTMERELKSKDYCGYDPRMEWPEDRFLAWRNSPSGKKAFELDTLASESPDNVDNHDDDGSAPVSEICDRKKCARHLEWSKLTVDHLRLEMSDNGDRMRSLDREESEIRARAALRIKTGALGDVGGTVELHTPRTTVADPEAIVVDGATNMAPTLEQLNAMAVDQVGSDLHVAG